MSIQSFCLKNKVSWNLFNKWYKDTRSRIKPVIITGTPEHEQPAEVSPDPFPENITSPTQATRPIRIMVDIRMTNGLQIRQKNLNFESLKGLVENLESICWR